MKKVYIVESTENKLILNLWVFDTFNGAQDFLSKMELAKTNPNLKYVFEEKEIIN